MGDVFTDKVLLSFEEYREQFRPNATLEGVDPRMALMLLPRDVWRTVLSVRDLGFEVHASVDAVRWKAHGWDCMYRSLPVTKEYEQVFHTGFSGQDTRNCRYSGNHKRLDQLMTDVRYYSAIDAKLNERGAPIHPDHAKGEMVVSLHRASAICDNRIYQPTGADEANGAPLLLVDDQWYFVSSGGSMHKCKMAAVRALMSVLVLHEVA